MRKTYIYKWYDPVHWWSAYRLQGSWVLRSDTIRLSFSFFCAEHTLSSNPAQRKRSRIMLAAAWRRRPHYYSHLLVDLRRCCALCFGRGHVCFLDRDEDNFNDENIAPQSSSCWFGGGRSKKPETRRRRRRDDGAAYAAALSSCTVRRAPVIHSAEV